MPADRTRGSKRIATTEDTNWDIQIDMPKQQSIAFAPNVTPGTFNDPPSPTDLPSDSMLFPLAVNGVSGAKRNGHGKKKPENHIPRPPNAFILFRSSFIKGQVVSAEVETNHSTLSKIVGLTWAKLPHEERQKWHAMAKIAQEDHKRKYPEYAFRPLHSKGKAESKRKVREVGPKDMKRCARIAELLVQGKKGGELSEAIAEFDKHHVPQIITRFETPITARAYRRSLSAPAEETEHSKPSFLPTTLSKRKARACSTEPLTSQPTECLEPQSPTLSQRDTESLSESYYDSPSPISASSPTFTFPPTDHSFETFTFNTTVAAPLQQCDPFTDPLQEGLFDAFYETSSAPCTPQSEIFESSPVVVENPQYNDFAAPSPFSSMPSTPPQTYPSMPAPSLSDADVHVISPTDSFAGFDFFSNISYPCGGVQAMTDGYTQQHYNATSKPDFATYYGRSDLASYHHEGISSSYLAPIPTYGL